MGDRNRGLRESRRLSQDGLAAILGVKGPSVSQWESGTTKNIRPENLLAICSFFKIRFPLIELAANRKTDSQLTIIFLSMVAIVLSLL